MSWFNKKEVGEERCQWLCIMMKESKFSAKQNLAYPIGVAVYMKAFLTGAKSELVTPV